MRKHDRFNQQGSILLVLLLLFPTIIYISYASLSRNNVELKITTKIKNHAHLEQAAEDGINFLINQPAPSLINEAILEVKQGLPPTWHTGTFTLDNVTLHAKVMANKSETLNSGPNTTANYGVLIKITAEQLGDSFKNEVYLVRIGVP